MKRRVAVSENKPPRKESGIKSLTADFFPSPLWGGWPEGSGGVFFVQKFASLTPTGSFHSPTSPHFRFRGEVGFLVQSYKTQTSKGNFSVKENQIPPQIHASNNSRVSSNVISRGLLPAVGSSKAIWLNSSIRSFPTPSAESLSGTSSASRSNKTYS